MKSTAFFTIHSKSTRPFVFLFVLSVLFFLSAELFSQQVPPLTGRVNDRAELLSSSTISMLEQYLAEVEQRSGAQIALLTIPSLEGDELTSYSGPALSQGDFDEAITIGLQSMGSIITDSEPADSSPVSSSIGSTSNAYSAYQDSQSEGVPFFLITLIVVIILGSRGRRRKKRTRGDYERGDRSSVGKSVGIYFLINIILRILFGGGGGGSSGGGFSGGGGSFGGGGASGGW